MKGARVCLSKSCNKGSEQLSEGEAVAGWWWVVRVPEKQPCEAASSLWGWHLAPPRT